MTEFKLDFADLKAGSRFIAKTLASYNAVAANLHIAASMAIHQAAAFGRCENLGKLYDGLAKNDQTALRIWVGKQSAYTVEIDGKETPKHWIEFDGKAKSFEGRWKIKPGTEEKRKASKAFEPAAIVLEQPFTVKENDKKNDPFTMVDLLSSVKAFIKRTKTKAENENLAIPAAILAEFEALEKIADVQATPVAKAA